MPGSDWARLRLRAIYTDLALLMVSGLRGTEVEDEMSRYQDEIAHLRRILSEEPAEAQETLPVGPPVPVA
jgi:hypothetical protein